MKSNIKNRTTAAGIICLLVVFMLATEFSFGINAGDKNPTSQPKSDERIHLIHSDVLYKRSYDPRADVLVGNVQLFHEGATLYCDSARFYQQDNSFDAFGNVRMVQGDTLTLVSDTLLYDGYEMKAHAIGNCVLTHRQSRLVTRLLDYDRLLGVGTYPRSGTLYDEDNVLVSDWGQYTTGTREAFFTDNVELTNPKFVLISDTLYYYTDTKKAKIVSPTNITADDGTFVYGERGDYDTNTGKANLMDRSYIIKDMRKLVGDSIYADRETDFGEAFGNAVLTDEENLCMLTGNYCSYDNKEGIAVATDSAVAYEYSQGDTLYLHADTLKMFTFNMNTDSAYHDIHGYHKVRFYRVDFQGVCDSIVSHELDSCTYLYGQPILWNQNQQIFGEEIRAYNNDSTITWVHIINQAMTIERLDSVAYNQVSGKEMFCYFKDGELEHNEAKGNVYVDYYLIEEDGFRIGMNYTETTELKLYMEKQKVKKIWMPAATGTVYPITGIPNDKLYLKGFAWFDYIRPKDKDDIFEWRSKSKENILKKSEQRKVPLQKLEDIE